MFVSPALARENHISSPIKFRHGNHKIARDSAFAIDATASRILNEAKRMTFLSLPAKHISVFRPRLFFPVQTPLSYPTTGRHGLPTLWVGAFTPIPLSFRSAITTRAFLLQVENTAVGAVEIM
jgi:hypothetical protein